MTIQGVIVADVCDALILEIEDKINLPSHNVLRYTRPLGILPQHCPLLAVWYAGKRAAFIESGDPLNPRANLVSGWVVGWWEDFTDQAKTLELMQDRYRDMLSVVQRIESLVIGLGVRDLLDSGGDPIPVWQFSFTGSETVTEEGLVEGYFIALSGMIDQHGSL